MRKIKSRDTKPEITLSKALWKRGLRYRKHDKTIYGTPDICFRKYKLAIFVDSEFFHGKNWSDKEKRPKTNIIFWEKKIEKNMNRDVAVNEHLGSQGWKVLRFWSNDVSKNLFKIVSIIEREIDDYKRIVNYLNY